MSIRVTLFALAVLAAGCTPKAYNHELDLNHPANPEAEAGKPSEPSRTLAIDEGTFAGDKAMVPEEKGSQPETSHGTHHGDGARANAGQEEEVLYECPMHPEITFRDPSRRCPKCNMKINKPMKDGGSPTGHEGHGGHSR